MKQNEKKETNSLLISERKYSFSDVRNAYHFILLFVVSFWFQPFSSLYVDALLRSIAVISWVRIVLTDMESTSTILLGNRWRVGCGQKIKNSWYGVSHDMPCS